MGDDGLERNKLHIALFPLMAPGHTIPILDIASLFSSRDDVKITIITTPLNASNISKSLKNHDTDYNSNSITLEIFSFPSKEVGLPEGIENLENIPSFEMSVQFMLNLDVLKDPLEKFLSKTRPDCLVADMFFPFATEIAAKFGIPRLVFHGSSFFAMCLEDALKKYEPQYSVLSDDECFTIPHLPHEIRYTKSQILMPQEENEGGNYKDSPFMRFLNSTHEAELKSYGVLFNSFYELELDYVDYFTKVLGRKAWHIGPVSLSSHFIEDKSLRGKMALIDKGECLKWLESKEPSSVVYVCFGSLAKSISSQVEEIALALEASGLDFIWTIPKILGKEELELEKEELDLLLKGFEERVTGKGLIVKGWAPQVLILDHEAVGGFLTHCGWNSILESISAGVPMATWPLFAEQFCNEKLVTDVLGIGVKVGSKVWNGVGKGIVLKREEIEVALKKLMVGQEALDMRNRAKKLKEMAHKAVEEGGSSFGELSALIDELKELSRQ